MELVLGIVLMEMLNLRCFCIKLVKIIIISEFLYVDDVGFDRYEYEVF